MTKEDAIREARLQALQSYNGTAVYMVAGEYIISGLGFKGGRLVKEFQPGKEMPPTNHNRFRR